MTLHEEKQTTYSIGHLALGYLSGKATSKLINTNINLPLLFLFSVIPDIDLLIPNLIEHRGPTHSFIIFALLFLPLFKLYGTKALPYLISLTSHTIGDIYLTSPAIGTWAHELTGGAQVFWPITTNWYSSGIIVTNLTLIYVEWTIFLASLTILLATKELWKLFKPHPSNLLLAIPIISIFESTFLGFPIPVPPLLIAPHLIILSIFALSILTDLKHIFKTTWPSTPN
ncbi:MAG: metal-dependent hydrolase [Candidatus Bathyarchaeota archaeon]|nr:MAG: metal-dependent hydrolase [Candidatus Bathyarchaeota archaeon]